MLVPWTPLSPSRRERSLRRLARSLAFVVAVLLLHAALRDGAVDPAAVLGSLVAATAAVLAGRVRPGRRMEIGVDDAGALVARSAIGDNGSLERGLQCVFAAPWLITLRHGTMWVRMWPDSVPGNAFRRFWVHIRWNPGRQPADFCAVTAPGRQE